MRSGLCLWIRALKARPSFQLTREKKNVKSRLVILGERFLPSTRGTAAGERSSEQTKPPTSCRVVISCLLGLTIYLKPLSNTDFPLNHPILEYSEAPEQPCLREKPGTAVPFLQQGAALLQIWISASRGHFESLDGYLMWKFCTLTFL